MSDANRSNISVNTEIRYTNEGQKLSIEILVPFSDKECLTLPKDCWHCPVGYHSDCGRTSVLGDCTSEVRADGCKLKQISIYDLLKNNLPKEVTL